VSLYFFPEDISFEGEIKPFTFAVKKLFAFSSGNRELLVFVA